MKKQNMRVFEVKTFAANGNDRTVLAIAPLDFTLSDVCEIKDISMLSVVSCKVSAPMTERNAMAYVARCYAATVLDPHSTLVRSSISVYAA